MDLKVGNTHEAVVIDTVTRTHIVKYAGAGGDFNPLHHDDTVAQSMAGYPSVFAHGMFSMGLTGRMLTDWLGPTALKKFGVRFTKQVWPGDTLTVTTRPGERWEKQGRRGGKLMFSETITEYRNQDGVLCVTARSIGVQTERAVDQ